MIRSLLSKMVFYFVKIAKKKGLISQKSQVFKFKNMKLVFFFLKMLSIFL